jgi:dTDP-4-amino-4,6-dideoxygalactose transaminase
MESRMIVPHSRPSIDGRDIEAVVKVLGSGNISQGENIKEFERNVASFVGVKHGIAVSSGTAALHLALIGLNVGAGDEVIIPSYVCASPYMATLHAGATPRIVDVDSADFNISTKEVEKALTQKTKAIIVPHMFGTPAELDELLSIKVPIIEDCAHSLGAEYKKRKVGGFGRASICSFYATKMITTGEGGMVLTDDDELYGKISEARQYDRMSLSTVRYNYKMTDFQAALGLSQMSKLPALINRRREIAKLYNKVFSELDIAVQMTHTYKRSVFYRYVVLLENLEDTQQEIKEKGVMCEKPVLEPLHKGLSSINLFNTNYLHNHALSIPLYPSLNEQEIEYTVETLKLVLGKTTKK